MENKDRLVIYVAGKYTGDTIEERDRYIKKAEDMAKRLLELGFAPICPHTMSRGWELDPRFEYGDYIKMDLAIINKVDAVLFLDNWQTSNGAKIEREHSIKIGKPIFDSIKDLMRWYLSDHVHSYPCTDPLKSNLKSKIYTPEVLEEYEEIKQNLVNATSLTYTEEELDLIIKMYLCFFVLDASLGFKRIPSKEEIFESFLKNLFNEQGDC